MVKTASLESLPPIQAGGHHLDQAWSVATLKTVTSVLVAPPTFSASSA